MKSILIVTGVLMVLGFSWSSAFGGSMYAGAGIGNTFFSSEVQDAVDEIKSIDENSTAWKIFGGFSGTKFIGIEGGYRNFGEITSTVSSEAFESKTSGWDIEALGRIEIAIVDIFAKAGVMFWSTDLKLLGDTFDDSGTDFLWGLGAGVHLGPIGVRLEWESVEVEQSDLSMVALSATLGF